jgi:tetratricopeptide (TPR) repeat protein
LNRRIRLVSGLAGVVLGLVPFWGCDYSAPDPLSVPQGGGNVAANPLPEPKALGAVGAPASAPRATEERTAILDSSITLIQRAALQPGGKNFELAVKKLNQYFEGTPLSAYQLEPPAREYLARQLPPPILKELANRNWNPRGDTRHIEDCMMYYGIANRVAGTGENIDRVRRVFEWVVQQVQLVPPSTLSAGRLPHAFARPYDVLLRGMATEAEGFWAERSWLFMVLCRQLDIDTGLITYTRSDTLDIRLPKYAPSYELEASLMGMRKPPKLPVIWICTALIDGKAYLFDARVGLEVPGPGGKGVATLEEALADPAILERMNLPGLVPYATSRASLLGSTTKIGILIDSSQGYFSPKMKLLQTELSGKNRTVLYRDPAQQRDHFLQVLGDRAGAITLWPLPLEVETRLFTDSQFVASIQASLFLFRPEFPLIYARVKQLRGEFDSAIEDYVRFRFSENTPLVNNKKQAIPREVQEGLDVYATYYLALAHLERNNLDQAELMFKKTLELLPEPGQNQPYYNMFRRGANANLGRIAEVKKDPSSALAHYTQRDPTPQYVGNLLRARELVWSDPMGAVPAPLPPAPAPKTVAGGP